MKRFVVAFYLSLVNLKQELDLLVITVHTMKTRSLRFERVSAIQFQNYEMSVCPWIMNTFLIRVILRYYIASTDMVK